MLEVHQLGCVRHGRCLFRDLSFTVEAGQVWQVRGANGSGKTSLLRMLAGLAPMDQGQLHWPYGREPVLWLGHRPAVSAGLSAFENLRYLAALEDEDPHAVATALDEVGLGPWSTVAAGRLSVGQLRRVALARLAFSRRLLWILDEPYTSLDTTTVHWLEAQLERQRRRGGAVVMATHYDTSTLRSSQILQLGV